MKILLVQTGFLGDVVLSTPVIAGLKEIYPSAEIWIMVTPAAKSLVEFHPAISGVITFDKRGRQRGISGFWQLRNELRSHKFEHVFSLHKSLRTSLLLFAAGIPRRVGFSAAAGSLFYTERVPRQNRRRLANGSANGSIPEMEHDVLRNLRILSGAVERREPGSFSGKLFLPVSDRERESALELLGPKVGRRIAVAPGSVWATKRWGGYQKLVEQLVAGGDQVVLIGGPEEVDFGRNLERVTGPGSVKNLIGAGSLRLSAALIAECDYFVGNDSAPLHLASAAGTPTVATFCATVPEFGFGPWQTAHQIAEVSGLSCRPCGRHGGRRCPEGHFNCSNQLQVQVVVDKLNRLSTLPQLSSAAATEAPSDRGLDGR